MKFELGNIDDVARVATDVWGKEQGQIMKRTYGCSVSTRQALVLISTAVSIACFISVAKTHHTFCNYEVDRFPIKLPLLLMMAFISFFIANFAFPSISPVCSKPKRA